MKKALMLTLGHNSSAIFYDGINKPIGYEEERLDKVKGSSAFPRKSIEKIIEFEGHRLHKAHLLISHWFDNFDPESFPKKYYDAEFIRELIVKYKMNVRMLSPQFTHHDAHAYSAQAFYFNNVVEFTDEKVHHIVADGFGNGQEVLSIYHNGHNEEVRTSGFPDLYLQQRAFGYNNSLGLLYQFATEYVGMKPLQDEYKFLGYESQVAYHWPPTTVSELTAMGMQMAQVIRSGQFYADSESIEKAESGIDKDQLRFAKSYFFEWFDAVTKTIDPHSLTHVRNATGYTQTDAMRAAIGFFIQNTVEFFFTTLVEEYEMKHIVLSGGCFYNVKLNNRILNSLPPGGTICVMPIAGDQGAAIGLYQRYVADFEFGDLCWGRRHISAPNEIPGNVHVFKSQHRAVKWASELIRNNQIVNIITGDMEFGPRALCHTSTLALPTKENTEYINTLNDRNTVMPMAPVLTDIQAFWFFKDAVSISSVIGSNEYMVITHEVEKHNGVINKDVLGVVHPHPVSGAYSARPQVVPNFSSSFIGQLLSTLETQMLINTSFNTHGTPILYSVDDAVKDFIKQRNNDSQDRTHLIILEKYV